MRDDCRKGVPPKRKHGNGSSCPGPGGRTESVGCVPERLHLFPREEGCRGRHGEAAIVTPTVVVEASAPKVYLRVTLASASTLSGLVVQRGAVDNQILATEASKA